MFTTATRRRSLLAMAGVAAGLTTILTPSPASAAPVAQTQLGLPGSDLASSGAKQQAQSPELPVFQTIGSDDVTVAALRNGICDNGEFCVYRDSNRTGPVIDWAKGVDDHHYGNDTFPITGGRVGDEGSSVWNRTGCLVTVYRDGDFGGPWVDIAPGAARNLGGTPVGNDRASSHNAQC
jgi:Peptidase inhibitor family I36